ncbi:MAG: transcriptional regulator, partial [Paenibacillus sp.]|nr:transcriptional regulator [Paenibacillus sp.]
MWRILKWTALTCTVAIMCVVGYYGYTFYQFGNNIQESNKEPLAIPFSTLPLAVKEEAPPKWEGKERVNILLLGADSRGTSNAVPRSDTIMLVSVNPATKKATMFSILRDTYVKIPGYGQDRINTAFALGGPNLAMKTVSDLVGLPIQYYVYTDFQGFMALVDAIGGIELDVEKDMNYRDSVEPEFDIKLKKGVQKLDGKSALQYVRFRHDALSDFARTERQRKFMTALAGELQSSSSIFRLPTILNKIDPYITTNLAITDMIKLGSLAFDVKAQGLGGVQIPPSKLLEEDNIGGASVLTVKPADLQKFVQEQLVAETAAAESDSPDTGADDGEGDNSAGTSAASTPPAADPIVKPNGTGSNQGTTVSGSTKASSVNPVKAAGSGSGTASSTPKTNTGSSGGTANTGTKATNVTTGSSASGAKSGTASGSSSSTSATGTSGGSSGA